MGKNSRIRAKKVRARKIAGLAAYSRQFTVNNNTIPKKGLNGKNIVTIWHEIRTTKYDTPVYGKMFEIDKDGHYHLIEIDHSWKHKKYPQPKSYWLELGEHGDPKMVKSTSLHKDTKSLNKVEYMEKLVDHKVKKWERKHPQPLDMFTEDVEKWKQERETAKERFRDFVVSIYDPLIIMGNRVEKKEYKTKAKKIAEVKDINGKGHDVSYPNLKADDKLYKNAESAAQIAMNKDATIIDADLMNHKRTQKRPLVGAKRTTLADKKLKKAA